MKTKGKRLKTTTQGTGMVKMNAYNYPCLHVGTRNPCSYHCKKCFFEIMYCHNN